MSSILQLKIVLRNSQPPIWRRFMVKDTITFHKLHEIVQVVMGWTNSHLYDFKLGNQRLSIPNHFDWDGDLVDSRKTKLSILKLQQKFDYMYDFGDGWEHTLVVEKALPDSTSLSHPICLKGSLSCPPEDCGGLGGYYYLLQIQNNKKHPEYKERIVDWLGEDFNAELFDIKEINKELMERFIDGRTRFWSPIPKR